MNQAPVQGDTLKSTTGMLLKKIPSKSMDPVLDWNLVCIQAIANDHDPDVTSSPEQGGPPFVSRAIAIIHGAMCEAMLVFNQCSKSVFILKDLPSTKHVPKELTMKVAIIEAAHQTLCALYSKQKMMFDAIRTAYLKRIQKTAPTTNAIDTGIIIGQKIARTILKERENDGSKANGTYIPNMKPGYHIVDPTHPTQRYTTPHWGSVKPFVLDSVSRFRAANIVGDSPSSRLKFLCSPKYIKAYNELKSIGSRFSKIRTPEQTLIAQFWGYDSGPKIGPAPRLCNQVARVIAIQMNNTLVENARLFALVNYAIADALISTFDTKYYYDFWRPIVAIRQGGRCTQADPKWLPLGAPADGNGDNFTPAHPSYTSGHVVASSGTFEILRHFYRTDKISFAFESDEYNGQTKDSITGTIRPAITRQYKSFRQAEMENYYARVWLGVHWPFDERHAQIAAHKIASIIYKKLY